mgnify:CR=1 FL=1
MKDIYVVTHTESEHHVQKRVGGWYDTPLTATGHAQAQRVASRILELVDGRDAEICSSDLLRALQTAEHIASALDTRIETMSDLRERSYGSAEGQPEDWLQKRVVHLPRGVPRLDHRDGIDNAETKREFLTRIYRAVQLIEARPVSVQVIVTHGYAMTFVVACWIGMPLENAGLVNFRASPGGITHLHEDDVYFNRNVMQLNNSGI